MGKREGGDWAWRGSRVRRTGYCSRASCGIVPKCLWRAIRYPSAALLTAKNWVCGAVGIEHRAVLIDAHKGVHDLVLHWRQFALVCVCVGGGGGGGALFWCCGGSIAEWSRCAYLVRDRRCLRRSDSSAAPTAGSSRTRRNFWPYFSTRYNYGYLVR